MKHAIIAIAAFAAAAPLAMAQTPPSAAPALDTVYEACLRDNAPAVSLAAEQLEQAIGFLMNAVCMQPETAVQIERRKAERERRKATAERVRRCVEGQTKSTDENIRACYHAKRDRPT